VLTWLDVLALFTAAAATAVGIKKGSAFLLVFPIALGVFWVSLDYLPPLAWPIVALASGVLVAQIAGQIDLYLGEFWDGLFGGFAGLVWGLLLAFTLWTGLPAEFSLATGAYRYPSPRLPLVVQEAVAKSPFALPIFDFIQREPTLRRILLEAPNPKPKPPEADRLPR